MDKKEAFNDTISTKTLNQEEITIEDLHKDLEDRLKEQGFIFDKRRFIFQEKSLSFGDWIADKLTSGIGTMNFIYLNAIWFGVWILINLGLLKGLSAFDPFPFGLLTMIVSLEAIFLSLFVLISQNRQAQRDKKQAEILVEKDIVDFKQDRLDLILDQKEWEILKDMDKRLKRMEKNMDTKSTK
jgi:uncharacterized membrane protein